MRYRVVQIERFPSSSEWSRTPTVKPTFHPFPRLPAELRVSIWAIALNDQTKLFRDRSPKNPNKVEIHEYDGKITAYTVRGYPSLFFVNREARYEAAKLDGGVWYMLESGIEIYANLAKERARFFTCFKGRKLTDSRIYGEGYQVCHDDHLMYLYYLHCKRKGMQLYYRPFTEAMARSRDRSGDLYVGWTRYIQRADG